MSTFFYQHSLVFLHFFCHNLVELKVTYRIAGVGSFNLGQAFKICIEHIHLLHQAGESRLCGLTNLLIHTFGLDRKNIVTQNS